MKLVSPNLASIIGMQYSLTYLELIRNCIFVNIRNIFHFCLRGGGSGRPLSDSQGYDAFFPFQKRFIIAYRGLLKKTQWEMKVGSGVPIAKNFFQLTGAATLSSNFFPTKLSWWLNDWRFSMCFASKLYLNFSNVSILRKFK